MKCLKLTKRFFNVSRTNMDRCHGVIKKNWVKYLGVMPLVIAMGGCVNVQVPSDPIVIQLNINITQKVVYRLAQDAGNAIEDNAGIF